MIHEKTRAPPSRDMVPHMPRALSRTVLLTLAVCLLVPASHAAADVFSVTRLDDPAPDACAAADCSLREAVNATNADAQLDVIALGPGSHVLAGEPLPDLTTEAMIVGAGPEATEITGGVVPADDTSPAGALYTTAPLTVYGVAFRGNRVEADPDQEVLLAGAVVANTAPLTFIHSAIEDNEVDRPAVTGAGGAMANVGLLTLVDTVVAGNSFTAGGVTVSGGVLANVRGVSVIASTVAGNSLRAEGDSVVTGAGGLFANVPNTAHIANSTISGNENDAPGEFGGVMFNAVPTPALIEHTTIAENIGTNANLSATGAGTRLRASVIAGGVAANCNGTVTSEGRNVEDGNGCGLAVGMGDLVNTDPLLASLAANGGPTETRALGAGSPAIDLVPSAECTQATDQRGVSRPAGAGCDAGAYEYAPPAPVNTSKPEIDGEPTRGSDVTCNPGSWTGAPTFAFAWLRGGQPIADATATTYRLQGVDVGKALQCRVTATTDGGSAVAESAPIVGSADVACDEATKQLKKAKKELKKATRGLKDAKRGLKTATKKGSQTKTKRAKKKVKKAKKKVKKAKKKVKKARQGQRDEC